MNYLRDKSCFGDFKVSSCITPGGLTLLLLFVMRLIFRLFCFKIFCDKIFKLMHFLHKLCLYSMYDWWWDGSMDNKDGVKQIYIEKNNFVNDMSKEIEDKKNPKNMR